MDTYKLDRTALSIINTDARDPLQETYFWLDKSPQERWVAVEFLRQVAYNYDPASARLQRVLTISQRLQRHLTKRKIYDDSVT